MLISKYYFWNSPKYKKIADTKNIPILVFLLIVMAIAWSGVKTIEDNYTLQKKISVLKQQNDVLALQNGNTKLQNRYYETPQYLDLAARQSLGLAGQGEKVLLVSKTTALKNVDQSLAESLAPAPPKKQSKYAQNFQAWKDFVLGNKTHSD